MTEPNPPYRFDFNPVAAGYDQWYETAEGRLFDQLEKRALQKLLAPAQVGDTLLEVGSGTGWWSHFFSGAGYSVTGADIAAAMVETALAKYIPNTTFKVADAHRLPFTDHSFAVSAAITSVEFTADPQQAIREMVRCTKPGGQLILGVLNGAAPLNRQRRAQAEGPFAAARFFTTAELNALLAPFGATTIVPVAFPSSMRLPIALAGIADDLQGFFRIPTGAFLAARVQL